MSERREFKSHSGLKVIADRCGAGLTPSIILKVNMEMDVQEALQLAWDITTACGWLTGVDCAVISGGGSGDHDELQ